jgi:RsiW-degrading membrane proteinase PrsW (M82 family)
MIDKLVQSHSLAVVLASLVGGMLPAFIWMRFWLSEENRPEPKGLIALTFIGGMIAVIIAVPLQKIGAHLFPSDMDTILVWAIIEEVLKFLVVFFIAMPSMHIDEPVDWPIYCVMAALGFAALENIFFLFKPESLGDSAVMLMTSNLRFLGSTLLHSTASSFIGLMIGLVYYQSKFIKIVSFFIGLILAITLHGLFNFFIIQDNGENFLQVFAFLWVVTIISILVFEKVRRIGIHESYETE